MWCFYPRPYGLQFFGSALDSEQLAAVVARKIMTTNRVALIRVRFQERDDFTYATSDDVPGLHVVGRFRESVEEDVTNILQQLYRLQTGLSVRVERTVQPGDLKTPTASGDTQTYWAAPDLLAA
jgi:hypothetical protein